MRPSIAIYAGAFVGMAALFGASAFIAHVFNHQRALGEPVILLGGLAIHPPWKLFEWMARWGEIYPRPFAAASFILLCGCASGGIVIALALRRGRALRPFGEQAWASFEDVAAAGLFADSGAMLGRFGGHLLAYDGPGHQILIGASRSGKGRGHVVPTLLAWSGSALVLDVKGELDRGDARHGFPGTSGYRAKLGPVLRFAPTDPYSNAFNFLLCVRKGQNEVRDVQNIVDVIVEPHGETRGAEQFWNKTAKNIITGVILHVLYAEAGERKSLAVVREKLADLDRTCDEMRRTLHRLDPATNQPQVHPEVLHAAQSYLSGEERLRSGVKATAESFFGVFADPIVAEKTSRSDFAIADLMCGERPVTLYLAPPPSDAARLMPLLRLFIAEVARELMESQTHARGRIKRHRLMLVLDEFPQLGRLSFFEKMMGAMAGYGLKAYLVCQSLNHIIKAYGRDNVILDNCAIITAFAAADPETAKLIAEMAGEVWEIRPQESEHRPRALLTRKGSITYREERRPLLLPADVRALRAEEQLIFAAGAKPIRAKKLRFDAEPLFAKRLCPPAPTSGALSRQSEWTGVSAIAVLPPEKKSLSAGRPLRPCSDRPAPQPDAAPDSGQGDLFKAAAERVSQPEMKISERALAGLRPPAAPSSSQHEAAPEPRRARGTGI